MRFHLTCCNFGMKHVFEIENGSCVCGKWQKFLKNVCEREKGLEYIYGGWMSGLVGCGLWMRTFVADLYGIYVACGIIRLLSSFIEIGWKEDKRLTWGWMGRVLSLWKTPIWFVFIMLFSSNLLSKLCCRRMGVSFVPCCCWKWGCLYNGIALTWIFADGDVRDSFYCPVFLLLWWSFLCCGVKV